MAMQVILLRDGMKKYLGILLDLDGSVYVGRNPIAGAREALERFRNKGLKILFLTNNSTMTSEEYSEKLRKMGIETDPNQFLTSGEAASQYILEEWGPSRVLAITGNGFKEYCKRMKHEVLTVEDWRLADCVVIGLDKDFNYAKLKAAYRAIINGARFIATNIDSTIPSEDGLDPGAGSIVAAVREAVGKEPIVVGKPSRIIMDLALKRLSLNVNEILVVGDRVETDVAAGKVIGADTALLLSGATTKEDLEKIPQENRPDYISENLLELYKLLERRNLI